MQVFYPIAPAAPFGPAVCAVSSFDGVHSGHVALAREASELARAQDLPGVAVVLWEGERANPDGEQPRLLTLLGERLALLGDLGCFSSALVVSQAPDTPPLAADALLAMIQQSVRPAAIVYAQAEGSTEGRLQAVPTGLAAEAQRRGIRAVPAAMDGASGRGPSHPEHPGAGVRSMNERIAGALLAGDVRVAGSLLGHPYAVGGTVISGDRRGRLLGFPTANLRLDSRKVLPADGIYAVRARLPGERHATHPAVVSLGVRPQFGMGMPRLLEVFLLDAALDLYGLPLGVEFVERLREERRFADVEALKEQMARDVEMARAVLNENVEST